MADDPPNDPASVRSSRSNGSASDSQPSEGGHAYAPVAGQQEQHTEEQQEEEAVSETPPPHTTEAAADSEDVAGTGANTTAAEDTRSYLTKLSDMQKEAIDSIYASAVDGPCQHVRELENTIQESFLNNCQQFDFLHFLKTAEGQVDESVYARNAPISPGHCEYCGAANTDDCGPECERPELFFRSKRPPFANNDDEWDPTTEYRIAKIETKGEQNNSHTNGVAESEQQQRQRALPIVGVAATGDAKTGGGEAADYADSAVVEAGGDEIDKEAKEDDEAWSLISEPFGKIVFEC